MLDLIRSTLFSTVVILGLLLIACESQPAEAPFVQSADGLTGYLGVAPSAILETVAPTQAIRHMHASQSTGDAHLTVAIFADPTGARVEDAVVDAVIRGNRHRGGRRLRLEPMRINDTITYGAFVSLARNDRYHIDVVVRRPGSSGAAHLKFVFDASGLPSADIGPG
jgi:hypothetical protein